MKCQKLGGLEQQRLLSHDFGGQKSEVKMSVALVSSEGCDGGIFSMLLSLSLW